MQICGQSSEKNICVFGVRLNIQFVIQGHLHKLLTNECLDLQAHGESVTHKNNIYDESSSGQIMSYFMQPGSKTDDIHVAEGTLDFD
jgi:hypothetical protein